ncbi:unnamed protein product [Prunus armeniaca]
MFDKASCLGTTNVRPLVLKEENLKHDADAAEKQQHDMIKTSVRPPGKGRWGPIFLGGGHWVLIIVRPAKETVYYTDSLPNRSVDEDMRNIMNTAIKLYNIHGGKQSSRKSAI